MITADKVTELFCMADDFCKFFDKMTAKYTFKSENKRAYHRDSTMSKAEIMLIMILFHDFGYDVSNISIWKKYANIFAISSPKSCHITVSLNSRERWPFPLPIHQEGTVGQMYRHQFC